MELSRQLKRLFTTQPGTTNGAKPRTDTRLLPSARPETRQNAVPRVTVEFLRSSRNGEKLKLRGNAWQIGTAPGCEIHFDFILDSEVGDLHAKIIFTDHQYWIIPTPNFRTWVNDILLAEKQTLEHGDKLTFGSEHGPEICLHFKPGQRPQSQAIPAVHVRLEKGEARRRWGRFSRNFTIGRSNDCDVQLNDPLVSLRHARVIWDRDRWCIEDLQSKNGTFLNGMRVQNAVLPARAQIALAQGKVVLICEIEAPTLSPPENAIAEIAQHYFNDNTSAEAGTQTLLIRRAFQKARRKHAERYWLIIGAIFIVLAMTAGALYYQSRRLHRQEELQVLAENVFYAMKSLELQMAALQSEVAAHPEAALKKQFDAKMQEQRQMHDSYSNFARDELGIAPGKLSEEEWLIYKISRIFGECDVSMPPDFVRTVKKYIRMWKSTGRFETAMARATANGYAPKIVQALLAHDMPPQFFYLALQETDFDLKRCGPRTSYGIAKGMWQFIPTTGMRYGLQSGPLVEVRRYDPLDERHNFEKSTLAAARYLRDIYQTEAQASGLMVMACYNWGEDNVQTIIDRMPENPRERNFWQLLSHGKIPRQTYDYVFYIVAAAVIGENPRLFGFDFDNPLKLE